jgi:hypothetical protein
MHFIKDTHFKKTTNYLKIENFNTKLTGMLI